MGTSTNAILVYGYDLGSDEEWRVEGAGEYGELPPLEWYDEDSEDDFAEQAQNRLLAVLAGFTETDWQADGYYDRQREAEQRLGVEFAYYCSGEYPMYILAAKVITVHRGDIKVVDPPSLVQDPLKSDWNDKLNVAVAALGLTPKQQRPEWLLCSYWA